ncbi:hypothetical protein JCM8547_003790 [Rhodosporidiobolus lusitaniae]
MLSRTSLSTLRRCSTPRLLPLLPSSRSFFSPPPPLPAEVAPLKSAQQHFLPVVHEELGSLRRQAFSSPANDARAYSAEELLAEGEKLRDKVVLVTGAGSLQGFGGQVALKAASYGAKVVVSDVREDAAVKVQKEIEKMGGQATAIGCDVSDWDQQVRIFKHAVRTYGHVDVVIANAGMGDDFSGLLAEFETDQGDPAKPLLRCVHVDLIGVIYSAKLAFWYLRRSPTRASKAFIAVGSVSARFAFPGVPLYAAAKHGILGLQRALYYDGLENGITVNTIQPWIVETPITMDSKNGGILADVPKGKVEDVVSALIKASTTEESGQELFVDEKGVFSLPHKSSGYLKK